MFLLLSNFASGHLPLTGKALKDVAVLDHCLTAGCLLFYTQAHLLPLHLPLWGLGFKTAVSSPLCSTPQPLQWDYIPVIRGGLLFVLYAIKTFCRL